MSLQRRLSLLAWAREAKAWVLEDDYDSEFRYADKSDEVAIEAMVRDFGRTEEAKRRYLEGKK